jgi:hypothetical protein
MRIARNELCPCGSGKKYKRCCDDNDRKPSHLELADRAERSRIGWLEARKLDEMPQAEWSYPWSVQRATLMRHSDDAFSQYYYEQAHDFRSPARSDGNQLAAGRG